MSKTIDQVSLLELLPPNLRGDPDIVAASQASDRDFQDLCGKIRLVYTIADIDHASSEVVDALAVEMNCDFYDQSLPLATRRRLVKNAYLYKYFMGTSYAVRKIVEDIYTGAVVREWFEYGAEPYHFKVFTDDIAELTVLNRVVDAIKAVKNVRSWFDGIQATSRECYNEFYGFGVMDYCHMVLGTVAPK